MKKEEGWRNRYTVPRGTYKGSHTYVRVNYTGEKPTIRNIIGKKRRELVELMLRGYQKPMDNVLKKHKRRTPNKPTEIQLEIMVGNGTPNGNYYPFGGV